MSRYFFFAKMSQSNKITALMKVIPKKGGELVAKYRHVYLSFWKDPKVTEDMTPEDRYFYLYLLTNPSTTQIGVYGVTKRQMAFDLGYSVESVNNLISRFESQYSVIKYNEETREVALLNWGKYNLVSGGKPIEDCIRKELPGVKDASLIEAVGENVANEKLRALYESWTSRGQN